VGGGGGRGGVSGAEPARARVGDRVKQVRGRRVGGWFGVCQGLERVFERLQALTLANVFHQCFERIALFFHRPLAQGPGDIGVQVAEQ